MYLPSYGVARRVSRKRDYRPDQKDDLFCLIEQPGFGVLKNPPDKLKMRNLWKVSPIYCSVEFKI